jgi:hypothetical protein
MQGRNQPNKGRSRHASPRPRDVLELLLACVLESDLELALSVLLHAGRHTDFTRLRKTLQTRRDVYAIPEDVATVDDNVALVNADAELDPFLLGHFGIALDHAALNLYSTAQSVHHASELNQHAVSGGLHDTTTVLGDLGVN